MNGLGPPGPRRRPPCPQQPGSGQSTWEVLPRAITDPDSAPLPVLLATAHWPVRVMHTVMGVAMAYMLILML